MDSISLFAATVTGDGPNTLVLANGLSTSQQSWDELVEHVPAAWRVVRFEYAGTPGAAAESWIADRYRTLDGYADDLRRLLETLDVTNAVLLGHSMGGLVGALTAIATPARITRLITLNASPSYVTDGEYIGGFTRVQIVEMMLQANADVAAWMAGFATHVLGDDAKPQHIRDYTDNLRFMRPDIRRAVLRSVFEADYRSTIAQIPCPTAILHSHDRAVPPSVGQYLADHIPNATYHQIDVTGHAPHITRPQAIMPLVSDLLRQHLS